jgi:hypothetical protein
MLRIFVFTLLAYFIFSPTSTLPTAAQTGSAGLQMNVYPAMQGYFKYGEWLPIWIELENNGPDLVGEVLARVTGSGGTMVFTAPVELPTVSRKRLALYVLPNNFTKQLEVQFVANNQVQASQRVEIQPNPNVTFLIGLVSPERGALALINGISIPGNIRRPIRLIDISLAELPERFEGLRSLDIIVLNNVDASSLTTRQSEALANWVRQGGRLVIGGGANAIQTVAGLDQAMLPVIPRSSQEIAAVDALSSAFLSEIPEVEENQIIPEIRVPGPFLVALGDLNGGQTIIQQDDIPLLASKEFGAGRVDWVALDLSGSPFDAWSGTTQFWELLIGPGAIYPEWAPADISPRQQFASTMPYTLTNLPMLDLPSTQGLALLLGVYILLVGPANYFFLRWRKKLHWAWLTIPGITMIFSVGAFGLGYALHGSDVFLNKVAVIELQSDGKAIVNSYLGLFSPGRLAYQVTIETGGENSGLVSPLTPFYNPWDTFGGIGFTSAQEITLRQGSPAVVSGLSMEQWSMQSFMVEGLVIDFGVVRAELRLSQGKLVGFLRNETGYTIEDAVIVWSKNFIRLGNLEPGQEVAIDMSMENISAPVYGPPLSYRLFEEQFNVPGQRMPPRQAEVRRSIIEALVERAPAYRSATSSATSGIASMLSQTPLFLGWVNQAPPQAYVAGEMPSQQTTAIVYYSLSFEVERGRVIIPSGLIPGQVVAFPIDGWVCGETSSTALYINRGEGEFKFQLPEQFRSIRPDTLLMSITSDTSWAGAPTLALFDWLSQQWVELSGPNEGVNVIPQAANYISPDGTILVRMGGSQNIPACYFINLGMEGDLP